MSSWYDRHILPHVLDLACGVAEISAQRAKLVPLASGKVLEPGIGTGRNMPFYDRTRVLSITGVDPALQMRPIAVKRIAASGIEVSIVGLSAERLPLDDASFDTIVLTYTLCSIPDPLAALHEMRRVLKPGGRMLFCEHGRAPHESVRQWQRRLQPLWGRIAGGCQLGRDIPMLLRQAGFALPDLQTAYLKGPRPLTYNYWGEARVSPIVDPVVALNS